MNAALLHIIQHSLGCDDHGQAARRYRDENDGRMGYYRNYYYGYNNTEMQELVRLGYMRPGGKWEPNDKLQYFYVTPEGVKAMKQLSPPPPKLSRAQARYRQYLDADCNMTFGEWLQKKIYAIDWQAEYLRSL
jgi:hypothetical protein